MAKLLHHIQPWMQRSIAEVEEILEWRMVQHTELKISGVHRRLDTFELQVLALPSLQVDVSTLQATVESLRADIDMILEDTVPEYESPSAEPDEDTEMADLFATFEIPPPPLQEHSKKRKGREEDDTRAWKKERREVENARRPSLPNKEAHQIRAVESAVGNLAPEMWRPLEALLIVLLLMRTLLRVSRLHR